MMIVPEASDAFLPTADDMLVTLADSYELVLSLLDNFTNYFTKSLAPKTVECAFIPAI